MIVRPASPAAGYSLPVGDAVSLAVGGVLLLALAAVLYHYWFRRSDSETATSERDTDRSKAVDPIPETGLSDDELIRRWLSEANGELPQKELTERSDWSKSKVSRLLSRMEDEGTVEKVSVGRENIVVLRDEDRDSP